MRLTIASRDVGLGEVCFSEEGLQKRPRRSTEPYELVVDLEDFILQFSPAFLDCVEELKKDDQLVGSFQPPFEGADSYPSLEELLALPGPLRMEMVDTFFVVDVLRIYLGEYSGGLKPHWLIVSLESLEAKAGKVVISGRARNFGG
jgi:hypothetical protein